MNKKLQALLGLNLLILLLTLGDFLALHDIQNDYVSTAILDYLQITTSSTLPSWTATSGEWLMVTLSFWVRTILLLASLLLLWKVLKENRLPKENQA